MRNLDLNAMGVEEMNVNEAKMINGGNQVVGYIDGIIPIHSEALLKLLLEHGFDIE